jgi:enamine deaminase RidA (YjgF/YER057c/UK114 family)
MASTAIVSSSPSGTKQYYDTANPYEKRFGYHRAVRKGPFIFVSGTTAIDPTTGKLPTTQGADHQAAFAFEESIKAITALGGTVGDVVRVRMFVARQEDTEEVGKAFSFFFNATGEDAHEEAGVAATMIVVGAGGFVDPEMLVEIEMDAVVS